MLTKCNAILLTLVAASHVAFAETDATYQVPVQDDPSLEPFATMALEQASARLRDNNDIEVRYKLPAILDGAESLNVHLDGERQVGQNVVHLVGTSDTPGCVRETPDDTRCTVTSSATCMISESNAVTCRVAYVNLQVQHGAAEAYMTANHLDADTIAKYQSIGQILQHQAQGIVFVPATLVRDDRRH